MASRSVTQEVCIVQSRGQKMGTLMDFLLDVKADLTMVRARMRMFLFVCVLSQNVCACIERCFLQLRARWSVLMLRSHGLKRGRPSALLEYHA